MNEYYCSLARFFWSLCIIIHLYACSLSFVCPADLFMHLCLPFYICIHLFLMLIHLCPFYFFAKYFVPSLFTFLHHVSSLFCSFLFTFIHLYSSLCILIYLHSFCLLMHLYASLFILMHLPYICFCLYPSLCKTSLLILLHLW